MYDVHESYRLYDALAETVARPDQDRWNMAETLRRTGSVVTSLSVMGVTIVKGAAR